MRTPIRNFGLIAATAFAVAACSGGGGGGGNAGPPPNTAPTIAALSDVSINQDTSTSALPLIVSDQQSASSALTVSVTAADNILLPTQGIVLAGSGASMTLTLTPAESATGSTMVTVTARDPEGLTTTRSFNFTAQAVNASFTQFVNETFPMPADAESRSFVGFTLDNDADDDDAPFDALLQ